MTRSVFAKKLQGIKARVTDMSLRIGGSLDGVVGPAPETHELIIYDNAFPHSLTGFRLAEFQAYLDAFPTAQVQSTGDAIPMMDPRGDLQTTLRTYSRSSPKYRNRVVGYNPYRKLRASLLYTMFLHNAFRMVEKAEQDRVPFLFGLNPGGGFLMNNPERDGWLRRITSSPQFRGVLTTQRIARDYLIKGSFCSRDQIHYIFGVPCRPLSEAHLPLTRQYWGDGKDTLDISFVAFKYMPQGRDKGYDIFIDVAHRIHRMAKRVHFHVVGPYEASDIDVRGLGDHIHFYGAQGGDFLGEFHRKMDLNLSPNRPFVLSPGAFDGFPLTCSVESALCGSAMCVSDELHQNDPFVNGRDMLIVEPVAPKIVEALEPYLCDPFKLRQMAQAGREKCLTVYGWEHQMKPRIEMLRRAIAAAG